MPAHHPITVNLLLLLISAHSLTCAPSSTASIHIRIGTRSSKLALTQAYKFEGALRDSVQTNDSLPSLTTEIVHIDSAGDQKAHANKTPTQKLPLAVSGVDFTGALDEAVRTGRVDVAVHSMKDIPPESRWNGGDEKAHLAIGACLGPRATPLDALISRDGAIRSIQTLPEGATVGSASIRRQAQLKSIRPDLDIINIRGNVDTRLRALDNGEVDALVLAMAGLTRLGIVDETNNIIYGLNNKDDKHNKQQGRYHYHTIPIETMLPGLGQGMIAVACQGDNTKVLSLLKEVDNHEARISTTTERAFLDVIQRLPSSWKGRPPLAGYMRRSESSSDWKFDGLVASPDGVRVLRVQETIPENCGTAKAQTLGRKAGEEVLRLAGNNFLDGFYV